MFSTARECYIIDVKTIMKEALIKKKKNDLI